MRFISHLSFVLTKIIRQVLRNDRSGGFGNSKSQNNWPRYCDSNNKSDWL